MNDRNDRETIARGERAQRAIEEFIAPNFDYARQQYMKRIVEVAATELHPTLRADKITTLAVAVRVLDEVQNGVTLAMREGEHVRAQHIAAEKLEKLTDTQRRLIAVTG